MDLTPISNEHFLLLSKRYRADAEKQICNFIPRLTKRQARALEKKLQLDAVRFNAAQYIQLSSELSVAASFEQKHPEGFIYERRTSGGKDVDFHFQNNDCSFNVEVKCLDLRQTGPANKPILTLSGPQLSTATYEAIREQLPDHYLIRSRLLALKSFFESARDKFIPCRDDEYNILVICCYDDDDFADVLTCLAGDFGVSFGLNEPLRTQPGNIDAADFSIIDGVVVTNIANLHKEYASEPYIDAWKYSNSFCVGFPLLANGRLWVDSNAGLSFKMIFHLNNDHYVGFCRERDLRVNHYYPNFLSYMRFLKEHGVPQK